MTINGSGTGLIYKPTTNYNGSDDFTYEITDASPLRALGHVHVEILDTSKARSNPDTFRVARESTNNILLVLANDYTLPKTLGAFAITGLQTNGVHATIALTGTGTNNALAYTPNPKFIGVDHFSYEFVDTLGNRGTNAVAVTVGNLAPLDDAFNVVSGSTTNGLDVRANDFAYPDTNALRVIASIGATDHGGMAVTNSGATAILYSPAPGFVGVEHFNYQLNDDSGNVFSANVAVSVRRIGSDRDTNLVTMTVVGVNDLPTIVGAQNHFHITDKMTVKPFTIIVFGDRDEFGFQTNVLTVSLDNAVKGTLTNLGGFVNISPGVYQMQDSPPAITASLKTLVFVPTENRIIVPTSETTTFTIVANDSYVLSPISNSITTVIVDSVNDAPVISGTQGDFQINDKQTVQPFTNVIIAEVDDSRLQSLIVRVSLDNAAKGVLQNLGGFTNSAPGIYTMLATATNVSASIRNLVFRPTSDQFGASVAISNTLVVVGAPQATVGPLGSAGKVYLFERDLNGANQWGQFKRLVGTNVNAGDTFGTSVAISGDNVAVGAPLVDVGASGDLGGIFVFGRNQTGAGQWGLVKKIIVTNAPVGDRLGNSVSISDDSLVIGVPLADLPGTNDTGAAYLYQQHSGGSNQWGQVDKWHPTSVGASDNFGSAVAISHGTIVVGAFNALESGVRYGNAFMYPINFNNAPQNLLAVPNQSVNVGVPFTFAVPAGAFVDPDYSDLLGDVLGYSLGSSPAVPVWLNFDAVTGNFTGTPTAAGTFPITLIATDLYGASVTTQFTITSTGTNGVTLNVLSASMPTSGVNAVISLRLNGNAGVTCRLQQATNLVGAVWVDVASQTADGNGVINLNVTNPPSPAFYRTVWP